MTEQPPQPPNQPQLHQPQQPYAPPPAPPYRRLTRTARDSPVSGVCGGVARYLCIDPTVVRVLAVIAMVATFPVGPIVYAVMWAVMPKE